MTEQQDAIDDYVKKSLAALLDGRRLVEIIKNATDMWA